MRQAGILAAAALHGIDVHLPRLAEDHARAKAYAPMVDGVCGARVVPPDTNIVMLDLPEGLDAASIVKAAAADGVLLSPWSRSRIRAVMHLDADDTAVRCAAEVVVRVIEAQERRVGR